MKVWRWLIPGIMLVACASFWFVQKNQVADNTTIRSDADLGDLDGDGDMDALFMTMAGRNMLWINQGGLQGNTQGKFNASLQRIGDQDSLSAALGDLDGDGDLDAIIGSGSGFEIYLNSGGPQGGWQGNFDLNRQVEITNPSKETRQVELGDLDDDGDLDVIFWVCCGEVGGISIWRNDGKGSFTQLDQFLDGLEIRQAALGDLDGDRDLDVWIVPEKHKQNSLDQNESIQSDQIWLNDGSGHFSDSGLRPGASLAVALGDLDGDGDLDACNTAGDNLTIWRNDGSGRFNHSLLEVEALSARAILLGDLDQDRDLDLLLYSGDQVEAWMNAGPGNFELSAQRIALPHNTAVALGDLDGDGDLDLFGGYPQDRYRIWWNDGYGRLGLSWR